ncbi:MAG TPA: hypothetical protein VFF11_10695, partial [Candidatus Binatia bacterium]|nr:hypothetical protein [Candidatus Binatia bacterium]
TSMRMRMSRRPGVWIFRPPPGGLNGALPRCERISSSYIGGLNQPWQLHERVMEKSRSAGLLYGMTIAISPSQDAFNPFAGKKGYGHRNQSQ